MTGSGSSQEGEGFEGAYKKVEVAGRSSII